ncbi:MAG TPA: dienelactone hydrolase family protein [Beijerinckiaceae bacterium]|jgi:carboxymethylenebutenolidase|nr:dienelactone hydrolase family protein [Beijerinckiaceae bacterium]
MAPIFPLPPRWDRKVDCGWVEFKSGNDDIRGFFAKPKGDAKGLPAIVMVHENLGVIEHRQDVTKRLADLGYVTLTVDLFSRVGGRPPQDFVDVEDRRRKAFVAARDEQAVPDLEAGCDYLASLGCVDMKRVGALGYCMGGGTMLDWICGQTDRVKAAVAFYPTAIVPPQWRLDNQARSRIAVAPNLSCPLDVHFGEKDNAVPPQEQVELELALAQAKQPVNFYRHAGANHAYHDDTHPNYHAEASKVSWAQTLAFFEKHLGKPVPA